MLTQVAEIGDETASVLQRTATYCSINPHCNTPQHMHETALILDGTDSKILARIFENSLEIAAHCNTLKP